MAAIEIITKEDLQQFREQLFEDIENWFIPQPALNIA